MNNYNFDNSLSEIENIYYKYIINNILTTIINDKIKKLI